MLATCTAQAAQAAADSVTEPMLVVTPGPDGTLTIVADNQAFRRLEIPLAELSAAAAQTLRRRCPVLLPADAGRPALVVMPAFGPSLAVRRLVISAALPLSGPAAALPAGGPRLLLVEDNRVNQAFAQTLLQHAGYRVDTVTNGTDAIAAAAEQDYAAILMDVQMPVMDGLTATSRIRTLPPPRGRVPVIALTAHALPQTRAECLEAGMNDYIAKPIFRAQLLEVLTRWVAGAEPEAQGQPEPEPGPPPVDEEQLTDLLGSVRPSELNSIVTCFLADVKERLSRLEQAARVADLRALGQEAHDLSSSAGSFGATEIMARASELEIACRAGERARALELVRPLPDAIRAFSRHIERRFAAAAFNAPIAPIAP